MFLRSFVVLRPLRVYLTLTSILYPFEVLRSFTAFRTSRVCLTFMTI